MTIGHGPPPAQSLAHHLDATPLYGLITLMTMIRLQTASRNDIPNIQRSEISAFERNWAEDLPAKYLTTTIRTDVSALYNCHGLTFASRRTRIEEFSSIALILRDDKYEEVPREQALPGDIVIYYDDSGDLTHSGLVVLNEPPLNPLICSKWGNGPEFVHGLYNVPSVYGADHRFYRCRL